MTRDPHATSHRAANPYDPFTYKIAPRQFVCNVCGFMCPTGPMGERGNYPGAQVMLTHLRTEHKAQKIWDDRRV